ncbi:hypothetical protein GCM10007382_26970 [Salinibacterium xinjiangense]|uniref:Predicted transcriptional regulator n=1 Tax=Salinibacterium xinjiangense TaxID=386302 RepID=A0A2C8ZVB6_9MICO|nr:BlaI/MecI/CopY family transcriptional regulator [Salinibacterium xinjiangense]GGL05720.1 hypothetical protein GCM10007382_26970 [Salinibacterium xinjiangense]SOE69611.1 Predicted transcriptional regulator [Salinibacterium xinjiangense]
MTRPLGTLEQSVMDRLWSWSQPVAVREVLEDLRRDRMLAYTTVMTVMDNLHRNGVLTPEKDGRAYVYRPAVTREQFTAVLMGDVLAGSANTTATFLHFLEQMPPAEVASLCAALDGHEKNAPDPTP